MLNCTLLIFLLCGVLCFGALPVDPVCQTFGRVSRDPALSNNVYLRKKDQKCEIPIQGGGTGLYTFVLNKNSIPRIDNALVIITAANLDQGTSPEASGSVYAIKLGGANSIAGQVLGSKLGGSGSELANLFPQSKEAKAKWEVFEAAIYKCIKSGQAKTTKLRWLFHYQTFRDTRPFSVSYAASFSGGSNTCSNLVEYFDN